MSKHRQAVGCEGAFCILSMTPCLQKRLKDDQLTVRRQEHISYVALIRLKIFNPLSRDFVSLGIHSAVFSVRIVLLLSAYCVPGIVLKASW